MDIHAASWIDLVLLLSLLLMSGRINGRSIVFVAWVCSFTPVDFETFVIDNGGTKKKVDVRNYAGVNGDCPFAGYVGSLGFCLELALRPGAQHSAAESEYNFERALSMVASLVVTSLLVRADLGFCLLKLMESITAQTAAVSREIAFTI